MLFNYAPVLHDIHDITSMREQIPEINDAVYGRHALRQIGIMSAEAIQRFSDPIEIAFDRILRLLVVSPGADVHVGGVSQDPVGGALDVVKKSQ